MVEYFIHQCYLKKIYDYADFESFHLENSDRTEQPYFSLLV